jgi:hypothetical protein
MKVKDIKKLLTIGNTRMSDEVKEQLKQIGFSQLPECLKDCGLLIWEVNNYEIYIEYPREDRRYNEGVEKVMEIIGEGFYGEVYRVVSFSLYIIHLATGFDEYFNVQAIDKEDLEEVGFMQVSEGFIYCGDQDDASEAISQLVAITPAYIKVY